MMIVTTLDRHIGRSVMTGVLIATGVLLALLVFIVLVDALGDYGKGTFGLYELIKYVILSQPRKIYELFPTMMLVGTLMGMSSLALNYELVAMRAAGVSVTRIIGSAMKVGLVLVIAVVAFGEWVVPVSETEAQLGRARALSKGLQQKNSGLWLRDGEAFVNIGEILPDLSMLRVNIYRFEDSQLRTLTFARRATFSGKAWRLEDVSRSRISASRVRTQHIKTESWQSTLTPDVIGVFAIKPQGLSMWHLSRYIGHLRRNNQDTGRYQLAWWQKLFMPLATLVMVLLATPFVFRQIRSGGLSRQVFIGIMLGLVFVVLNRSFGYVGLIYGLPPPISAFLPIALFLFLAIYLLRRSG